MTMTSKTILSAAKTTAWVKFAFIGSILRPAQRMESMKPHALRSTSINRRMLPHSRASPRRRQWKSRCFSRRNSLCIISLLRRNRYNRRFNSSPCSSLPSRYNSRLSSLFMFNPRRSQRQRLS